MALLEKQAFEEITVTDICEQAMVHRTTFYKHYTDKYALLERGMRQMYDVLVEEVHLPPHAFSIDQPPPYFVHLFTHVAEHQRFYKLMLCGEGMGRFQRLLKDYLVERTEEKIRSFTSGNKQLPFPPIIHAQFLAGAVIALLAWWVENDMPYPPQQMAQYLFDLQRTPRKQ